VLSPDRPTRKQIAKERMALLKKDVDIMGVQRGEHKDGPDVCPKYEFKIPGGINPDGTPLWGWNDAGAAFCKNCGCRDVDHVVLRDFTEEAVREEREKVARQRNAGAAWPRPPRTQAEVMQQANTADPTAANPPPRPVFDHRAPATESLEAAAQLGMYELEPGVPDPLAMNAYQSAAREQSQRQASRAAKVAAEAVSAVTAKAAADGGMGDVAATGGAALDAAGDDETERFKAEVERMVKEQLAKEKLSMLTAPAAGAPASVKELLGSLGLEQYLARFEAEEMEIAVLVSLARSEGKEALDEALKEVGVNSIGHRLKIFAALQAA